VRRPRARSRRVEQALGRGAIVARRAEIETALRVSRLLAAASC
jgi:hypothetical protein